MKASKSFDDLNIINLKQEEAAIRDTKKSRTSRFITRIFKRKSMSPATVKRSKAKSIKDPQRDSTVSTASSVSESRERCLTASVSMPDISGE